MKSLPIKGGKTGSWDVRLTRYKKNRSSFRLGGKRRSWLCEQVLGVSGGSTTAVVLLSTFWGNKDHWGSRCKK